MIIAIAVIIGIFIVIFAAKGIKVVRPHEKGLIERLGKFRKTADAGLHLINPLFERMTKIDIRERVIDIPPQEVITKDNVGVTVDAVVYFEVTDPYKVIYNVARFEVAAIKLSQTNLRNLIGELSLDESLTSRQIVNTKLRDILDEATDKWGVRVTRVELKKIDPPKDITDAMSKQMKAERTKRAAILEAEGIKQAAILKAEGSRQAKVLEAEGEAGAIEKVAKATKYKKITIAQGEGQAVETVFNAIHTGKPTNDLLAIKYLETLQKMADGKATKIFLPIESSGVMGSIAGIAELFKAKEIGLRRFLRNSPYLNAEAAPPFCYLS